MRSVAVSFCLLISALAVRADIKEPFADIPVLKAMPANLEELHGIVPRYEISDSIAYRHLIQTQNYMFSDTYPTEYSVYGKVIVGNHTYLLYSVYYGLHGSVDFICDITNPVNYPKTIILDTYHRKPFCYINEGNIITIYSIYELMESIGISVDRYDLSAGLSKICESEDVGEKFVWECVRDIKWKEFENADFLFQFERVPYDHTGYYISEPFTIASRDYVYIYGVDKGYETRYYLCEIMDDGSYGKLLKIYDRDGMSYVDSYLKDCELTIYSMFMNDTENYIPAVFKFSMGEEFSQGKDISEYLPSLPLLKELPTYETISNYAPVQLPEEYVYESLVREQNGWYNNLGGNDIFNAYGIYEADGQRYLVWRKYNSLHTSTVYLSNLDHKYGAIKELFYIINR